MLMIPHSRTVRFRVKTLPGRRLPRLFQNFSLALAGLIHEPVWTRLSHGHSQHQTTYLEFRNPTTFGHLIYNLNALNFFKFENTIISTEASL